MTNRTKIMVVFVHFAILAASIYLFWISVPDASTIRILPRYALADSYNQDSDVFSFLDDPKKIANVGCLYDSINGDDTIDIVSIHDQNTVLSWDEELKVQNYFYGAFYNQYRESNDFTFKSNDVKSVQINQNAWNYYNLSSKTDASIPWQDIDYNKEVPIILGHTYQQVIPLGAVIDVNNYIHPIKAKVVGYLDKGTRILFNDNARYSLDDHVVIPYPPSIKQDYFRNQDEFGKIALNMISTEVVPIKDAIDFAHVEQLIKGLADRCSFNEYDVIDDFSLRVDQFYSIRKHFIFWNMAYTLCALLIIDILLSLILHKFVSKSIR